MDPFNIPKWLLGGDPTGLASINGIRSMLGGDPTGVSAPSRPYGSQFYDPTPALTQGLNQQLAAMQSQQQMLGANAAAPSSTMTPQQRIAAGAGLQGPQPVTAPPPTATPTDRGPMGARGAMRDQAFQAPPTTTTPAGGWQNPSDARDYRKQLRAQANGGFNPSQSPVAPPSFDQNASNLMGLGDQIRARVQQQVAPLSGLGDQIRQQVQDRLARQGINVNLMTPPQPNAQTPPLPKNGPQPSVTTNVQTSTTPGTVTINGQPQTPGVNGGAPSPGLGGVPSFPANQSPVDPGTPDPTGGSVPPVSTPPTGSVEQQTKVDKTVDQSPRTNASLGDPADDKWAPINQWDSNIVNAANQAWQDAINAGEIAPGTPVDPALYASMKSHVAIETGWTGDPNATNPQGAYGLGQLTHNAVHANEIDWNQVYDPDYNLYWVGRELISRYVDPANPNGWVGADMGYFSGSYSLNGTTDASNGTTDSDYYTMMQQNLAQIEAASPMNQTPINRGAKKVHDIQDVATNGDQTVPIDETVQTGNTKANALLDYARQFVGHYPYAVGATRDLSQQPSSFDCSSFVRWVYYHVTGQTLGATTYQQINEGTPVSWQNLKPGDLVFFDTWTGDGPVGSSAGEWGSDTTPDTAEHVGIYLGNGKMVNALNPDEGIKITDLNTPYWEQSFVGGRRLDW